MRKIEEARSFLCFEIRNILPYIQAKTTLILEHYDYSTLPSECIVWLKKWQSKFELWAKELENYRQVDIGDLSPEESFRIRIKINVAALDGIESAVNEIKTIPTPNNTDRDATKCWENIISTMKPLEERYQRMCSLLPCYESGYLNYDNCDIVITKVRNKELASEMITNLNTMYVIPEKAHGVVWKIPEPYTKAQISIFFESLPCTINIGYLVNVCWVLESFKKQDYFEYYLQENQGHVNSA